MADNVTITGGANATPPDATVVATDQIGGAHYQRIKTGWGADGAYNDSSESNPLPISIEDDVETTFDHGAKSGIGAVAVQITAASIPSAHGVLVKAANANTGIIYVGNSDVTAGTTDATDGFELGAGESVLIKVSNANLVYVVASVAGQKVFWVTV